MMSRLSHATVKLSLLALSVALVIGTVQQASGQEPSEVPINEPTRLYVRAYDGTYLAAAIRRPKGEGPFPAILFIHGGLGGGGAKATGRVRDHFFSQGCVVMGVDYRRYHFGEEELLDAIAGYRHLANYPFVDKDRVGVIGGSHGGYLAMMLATREHPAAVVSFAGLGDIAGMFYEQAQLMRPTIKDWRDWRERLVASGRQRDRGRQQGGQRRRGGARTAPAAQPDGLKLRPGSAPYECAFDLAWRFGTDRSLYQAISPKDNVDKMNSPLLYLVGGRDGLRIPGKQIVEALRKRGVTAEYSEHEGMGHGFYWGRGEHPPQQFYDALKVTSDFINRHLKAGESSHR